MTERNPYHPDGLWPTAGSYTRTDEQAESDPRSNVGLAKHFRDQRDDLEHRLNLAVMASEHNSERAEKAEMERDEARNATCADKDAHWRLDEALASLKEANATVASLRAEQPRSEISSRNVVDFLADSLSNLSDSDRDYLSRILANSGR